MAFRWVVVMDGISKPLVVLFTSSIALASGAELSLLMATPWAIDAELVKRKTISIVKKSCFIGIRILNELESIGMQ